jgi:hypothetical protein
MSKLTEYINLYEFINYIKYKNNVEEIINDFESQSEKGFIFERLWDLVIKFGFCQSFPNSEYEHIISNINNGDIKTMSNLETYVKNNKVCSGNSGGCSDITLYNQKEDKFIFISSKYPKCDDDRIKNKSVDYYDVQNILAVIKENDKIYKNYDIYLLVPNKKNVIKAIEQSNKSSSYITKHMKNILDKNDLQKFYSEFIQSIKKYEINEYNEIYGKKKDSLKLFFHQELIIKNTSEKIEEGEKQILWGCKCRSGKTYMAGGIILNQYELKKIIKVLIITPAPTETAPQFTEDLFNRFIEFKDFDIHHIKDGNYLKNLKVNKDKSNIFVASKQLLQNYTIEKRNNEINNLDMIIFDENHFSGTTEKSKEILKTYCNKETIKIYLTATYNKPLKEWNIKDDCKFFWDIEDEQICKLICSEDKEIKEREVNRLVEKHGQQVFNIINDKRNKGYKTNDIFNSYLRMPELCLLTSMFDNQRYEIIKNKTNDSVYGFSFDALLSMNKQKTRFEYEEQIKIFLRYISGSNKDEDYKNGDKSIFTRINKICTYRETRNPFTQIWFLPPNNINETSKALIKVMNEDDILKKYSIHAINSKNEMFQCDIKEEINKIETIAKNSNKKGVILLAGNMLGLGITLKNCDLVMLFNNTLSSDKVMQQMYRCMTEEKEKKLGFVVDLNIGRVLNTCINYSVYNKSKNLEEKIKYLIEYHLINIDVDYFENKKINSNILVEKLINIWKDNPINNLRVLLRNLDNEYIEFDNNTQKLLNKLFTSSTQGDIKATLEVKEEGDELQSLKSGKEINSDKEESEKNELDKELEEIEKAEKEISFTKDVLPYIIPLTCILSIKDTNKDFMDMLIYIKNNPELLEIFNDQSLIWWNEKDLINIISEIIKKYINKESNTFNISLNFKMSIQSLLDKPKELLELISDCLKPKQSDKKQFGEVFTPMDFINDKMLKDIEDYWLKNNNQNIWNNEKLKWYDPAAGMGNYPIAIYYKLMEGLKTKIPNEKQRKKHIIEKQLYMGELNKKNCFVIKQIFNINNEYKLNLYEGDTLNIKINEVFGINKFNIIIGNPPYNEILTKVGAKPLYNKFIEYYVNKCDLLSFIVPSRWFAGGKGLDKFREMMINRTDILYIKHYDDACKIFGNTVSIEGGVNYFLIDKDYNGLCYYNGSKVKLNDFDIILDSKYYGIVNKFINNHKITELYLGRYFGIESNDKNLTDDNKLIKCYVSQQKGFIKYIDEKFVKNKYNFYKVITARANGGNGCFGNIFIGKQLEIHTGSYISFKLNSENEAKSLLSYMKCKLPNFMLSLRKISQDISESTCKWIPLPPLNIEWNDEEVYEYFKLSEDEIKLIKETKISGYNDIKSFNKNEPKIIKDGRKQYYLINDKLYDIKKDKSQGKLFGDYIDGKIIEDINNKDDNSQTDKLLNDKSIKILHTKANKKNIIITDD